MNEANVLRPRDAVARMAPYTPPTGGRAGKLRLDFNENTEGCPSGILDALRAGMTGEALAVYPEYGEVKAGLARFFGVGAEQLLLTNGTDEAIQVLVNTYVDAADEVVLLRPSYAMYRFYAELAGANIREVECRYEDFEFPVDRLVDAVGPATRAVLIANPNNPTGSALDADEIDRILQAAPDAAVLIDEAYYEFCALTALPLIFRRPNLFVSRTFSKAYGMAALRAGCLFSRAENIAYLRKAQSPYSVNGLAAAAALAAVREAGSVREYAAEVEYARDLLCRGLERLGIPYAPSRANFLLLRAGGRAAEIRDRLRARGVLVRDRSGELPGCLRVTIGTREQMRRLLQELEAIW